MRTHDLVFGKNYKAYEIAGLEAFYRGSVYIPDVLHGIALDGGFLVQTPLNPGDLITVRLDWMPVGIFWKTYKEKIKKAGGSNERIPNTGTIVRLCLGIGDRVHAASETIKYGLYEIREFDSAYVTGMKPLILFGLENGKLYSDFSPSVLLLKDEKIPRYRTIRLAR